MRIVSLEVTTDLPQHDLSEEEVLNVRREKLYALFPETYYLCPVRFKTEYNNPILYLYSAQEVAEAAKQTAVSRRPRNSMAIQPMHAREPNVGRVLRAPDTIDFEWVRERMTMCDERDCGKQNFYHAILVRAIDVEDMCIVDLKDGVRYVTLSYN